MKRNYHVLPCWHSAVLISDDEEGKSLETCLRDRQNAEITSLHGKGFPRAKFIPVQEVKEKLIVRNNSPLLPREIALNDDDYSAMCSTDRRNFAVTCYGPAGQDKRSNEDFALYAHFEEPNVKFCAVADGISNGYAFAQRGAQISVLAAYQVAKELADNISDIVEIDDSVVAEIREKLASRITSLLHEDNKNLIKEGHTPQHINENVWNDIFKNNPNKWYGNTLLVGVLTEKGGLCFTCGDGAVLLTKSTIECDEDLETKYVQQSPENSLIEQFVTFNTTSDSIHGYNIEFSQQTVELLLTTDGIDRTAQKSKTKLEELFSSKHPYDKQMLCIKHLEKWAEKTDIELDNVSVAKITYSNSKPKNCETSTCKTQNDALPSVPIPECIGSIELSEEKIHGKHGGATVASEQKKNQNHVPNAKRGEGL